MGPLTPSIPLPSGTPIKSPCPFLPPPHQSLVPVPAPPPLAKKKKIKSNQMWKEKEGKKEGQQKKNMLKESFRLCSVERYKVELVMQMHT